MKPIWPRLAQIPLNGDENDRGHYWRFSPQRINVEKAVVYRLE